MVKGRCCFHRSPTTETVAWSENMDTLLTNQGKIQMITGLKMQGLKLNK